MPSKKNPTEAPAPVEDDVAMDEAPGVAEHSLEPEEEDVMFEEQRVRIVSSWMNFKVGEILMGV